MLSHSYIQSETADRRRWSRYAVEETTTLTLTTDGQTYTGKIEDISLGGAKLHFVGERPEGRDAVLSHPVSGAFAGHPVWHARGLMGLRFGFSENALKLVLYCVRLKSDTEPNGGAAQPNSDYASAI